jgi:hypothetical protein
VLQAVAVFVKKFCLSTALVQQLDNVNMPFTRSTEDWRPAVGVFQLQRSLTGSVEQRSALVSNAVQSCQLQCCAALAFRLKARVSSMF